MLTLSQLVMLLLTVRLLQRLQVQQAQRLPEVMSYSLLSQVQWLALNVLAQEQQQFLECLQVKRHQQQLLLVETLLALRLAYLLCLLVVFQLAWQRLKHQLYKQAAVHSYNKLQHNQRLSKRIFNIPLLTITNNPMEQFGS